MLRIRSSRLAAALRSLDLSVRGSVEERGARDLDFIERWRDSRTRANESNPALAGSPPPAGRH